MRTKKQAAEAATAGIDDTLWQALVERATEGELFDMYDQDKPHVENICIQIMASFSAGELRLYDIEESP